MKIYKKDVYQLMSKLVHANKIDIKKLSQVDRKICMAALDCLAFKKDRGIRVNFRNSIAFDKSVVHISDTLDSRAVAKRITFRKFVISIVKGILNFLHLRVSSARLFKQISLIKNPFLNENWRRYLKDHCDVKANCDLSQAKIIFLGDQHLDFYQIELRKNIIAHYADEEQVGENLVLLEGMQKDRFPKKIDHKSFLIDNWDNKENYEACWEVLEGKCSRGALSSIKT